MGTSVRVGESGVQTLQWLRKCGVLDISLGHEGTIARNSITVCML